MSDEHVKKLEWTKKNAKDSGFFICPDKDMLDSLIEGLVLLEEKLSYAPCPCRISCGIKTYDSDIICPCEYRDADIAEFGMCYCSLFVSEKIKDDPSKMQPVPERRPIEAQDAAMEAKEKKESGEIVEQTHDIGGQEVSQQHVQVGVDDKSIPIWRCVVCGYLAARENPPPICPICKAKADKFEPFGFGR